jgi:transglutaminase-like putative cysteine protease
VEVLIYLLGSRYCETDRLSNTAWSLFGQVPKGWRLVKAICDYVHDRITFGYQHASPTKRGMPIPSNAACAATSPTLPSPYSAA